MNPKAIRASKDNIQQGLAHKLQRLFKKNNVNISQVAQSLNIPMMTIRRLISGETIDPRISTIKLIADHFGVTLDTLLEDDLSMIETSKHTKSYLIPLLDWNTASGISSIQDIDLDQWKDWQPVSLNEPGKESISKNAFAIESRPSMYPRFPQGSIFIIDPSATPMDGDIILIRIKNNNEIALRELVIDPPEWQLHPIVAGSSILPFSRETYDIIGVTVLTLLYKRKS